MSLAALRESSLWQRGLRRGSKGKAVENMQQRLALFGYDVGPIDGEFGYLTEDALVQFQREHGLRSDGVAGPEVWSVLNKPRSSDRAVHVVQAGERLVDLAAKYRVSEQWIRRTNRKKRGEPLYPGERIVLRSSCVVVGLGPQLSSWDEHTLTTRSHLFSGVIDPVFTYGRDGRVQGEPKDDRIQLIKEAGVPYVIGVGPETISPEEKVGFHVGLGRGCGAFPFRKKRSIEGFVVEIADRVSVHGGAGIFWDVGRVPAGYGRKLLKTVKRLKEAMPKRFLAVSMEPARRGMGHFVSDVDYKALARFADRIVIATHQWPQLIGNRSDVVSYRRLGAALSTTAGLVPPGKLLLGVPLGAVIQDETGFIRSVSYQNALTDGYSLRTRPTSGEDGFLRMTLPASRKEASGELRYIVQSIRSFDKLLKVASQYRLGGMLVHPMGFEDRRLWDFLADNVLAGSLM